MSGEVSRRDFVALMLGAPLAAKLSAGCGDASTPGLPPGVLVDTGMVSGHQRLRTLVAGNGVAELARVPVSRRHNVVIVGAGAAGLATAWALRQAGIKDVVVLEHCDTIGGTARGDAAAEFPHPWGAHYVVAPMQEQTDLTELLTHMGAIEGHTSDGAPIVDEALRCRDPEERIFYRGRWYDGLYLFAGANAEDRKQFGQFNAEIDRLASVRDATDRRGFAIPISAGANPAELTALDQLSFSAWLDQQKLTSPRLRWLTDYACRDDFGLLAKDTSAWAGLFYFAARQKRSGAHAQAVITWPNGNDALIQHLAQGQAVELGTTVVQVTPRDANNPTASVIAVTARGPVHIAAQHVVMCVPQFVARRVVAGLAHVHGEDALDYGAWAVANLHLRARPRKRAGDAPPSWDNVIYDSPSLGYVSATHQAGRDTGPTMWTWYYPFCESDAAAQRQRIAGASQADWADVVLRDLQRAHPDIRNLVQHIDIAFWGHGMVRPRVGSMWQPARLARATAIKNIHFAHTDLSGVALFEEAYAHARRAAREIVAAQVAAPT